MKCPDDRCYTDARDPNQPCLGCVRYAHFRSSVTCFLLINAEHCFPQHLIYNGKNENDVQPSNPLGKRRFLFCPDNSSSIFNTLQFLTFRSMTAARSINSSDNTRRRFREMSNFLITWWGFQGPLNFH
jgi:hypothetical protein